MPAVASAVAAAAATDCIAEMIMLSMLNNVLSAEDVGLQQSLLAEVIRGQPQQAQYRYTGVEQAAEQSLSFAVS